MGLKWTAALATLCIAAVSWAENYVVEAVTDKPDAFYRSGETVKVKVVVKDKNTGKVVSGQKLKYEIGGDGIASKRGTFTSAEEPAEFSAKLDNPGWLRFQFNLLDADGKPIMQEKKSGARTYKTPVGGGVGAMFDPEKIINTQPEPADFDAFWAAQRAELDKVPIKAVRTPEPDRIPKKLKGKVDLYDVKVDCAGGMPVSGYLAIPAGAKPRSLPAVVSFHGAGVRSANPGVASTAAALNCIAMDVNAHGIENGKPQDYYTDLERGKLKNYRSFGCDNRDTVYFKGMYLRVMRALDYVKSLPEWDGKILVVTGGSQGGGQTIAAAALDHDVTFAFAAVPALSEHSAWMEKPARRPGWPRFISMGKTPEEKEKISKAVAYYDNIYFARRIKCPIMLSTGFMDFTCSPSSVYAVYNNIPGEKKIFTFPSGNHSCTGNRTSIERNNYLKSVR